jgi:hypothetical protein
VILQRINLGMFALLGDLGATGNWRGIAEEIWPFVQAPPSTAMGEAEVAWLGRRPDRSHVLSRTERTASFRINKGSLNEADLSRRYGGCGTRRR